MPTTTLNLENATGHEVLAAAGKKLLRPGGRQATQQLLQWANPQPGQTVLELASSFGDTAIALAQQYGVRVVGIEKNPNSVARARTNVAAAGLSRQIEIIEGNIFNLDQLTEQFDFVLAEAILTMQSPIAKAKLLTEIYDRLKPNGKFLSHELLARTQEAKLREILSSTIRVNANPLSEVNWIDLYEQTGLQVQHHQTGAMGLLRLDRLIQDEGLLNTLQIGWNVATNPNLRQRVLKMRQVFNQYQQDLGYIILCTQKV